MTLHAPSEHHATTLRPHRRTLWTTRGYHSTNIWWLMQDMFGKLSTTFCPQKMLQINTLCLSEYIAQVWWDHLRPIYITRWLKSKHHSSCSDISGHTSSNQAHTCQVHISLCMRLFPRYWFELNWTAANKHGRCLWYLLLYTHPRIERCKMRILRVSTRSRSCSRNKSWASLRNTLVWPSW